MTPTLGNKPRYRYVNYYRLDVKQIFVRPEPGVIMPIRSDRWVVQSACGTFIVEPLGRRVVRPHG